MTGPFSPVGDDRPPARRELLVIWGEVRAAASMAAVYCLNLDPRQVFCVGNEGADSLRGVVPTAVLVLPGADSAAVTSALETACSAANGGRGVPFLDLRAVSA